MLNKLINICFFSLTLLTILGLFHFSTKNLQAQSCGGNWTHSYTTYECQYDPILNASSCVGANVSNSGACASVGPRCIGRAREIDGICNANGAFCETNDITRDETNGCFVSNPPSCIANGICKGSGGCCSGQSFADATCGAGGMRCGTAPSSGGGGGGGGGSPSCGNCSGCGSSSPGICIDFNDGKGCVIGSFCGGQNPNCGYDTNNPLACAVEGTRPNVDGRTSCCNGLQENWQGNCSCPWPPASCSITFTPSTLTLTGPLPASVTANVSTRFNNGENIDRVTFSVSGGSGFVVVPNSDNSSPYSTSISGASGSTTLTAQAIVGRNALCEGTLPVTVTPACNVTVSLNPLTTSVGGTENVTASVSNVSAGLSVTSVAFSETGGNTVLPPVDTTSPYTSTLNAINAGSATVTALVTLSNGSTCSGTANTNITDPIGWWQGKGGDIIAMGSLNSAIPPTCTLSANCNPYLNLEGLSGRPGNVIFGTNTNLTNFNSTEGKNWLVNSSYLGKTYDYNYFDSLIPSTITVHDVSAVNNLSDLTAGGVQADGYYWNKKSSGTLNINPNDLVIGDNKIIVFANGGVHINGNIRFNNGSGFFMLIANEGIDIKDTVTELEGIYVADGIIKTGNGSTKLTTRGSVVGWGGVSMDRDLGGGNGTSPGQVFEYDPPTIMLFPKSLLQDSLSWKELLP